MSYLAGDIRAFGAAVRREFRAIRRYPMLIIGGIFWPILLPANFVLLGRVYAGSDERALQAFADRSGTAEVAGFIFVGFAIYMWLSVFLWGPGTALRQEQLRGTLEAVMLTPSSRLVVLFGPPVAHLWTVIFQFVVMGLGLRFVYGVELGPDVVLRALAVVLIGAPSMYAIASLFSATVLKFGEIGPAVQFVRGALVLLAGISYPLVMLPGWGQTAAAALPTTYIVSDVRKVLLSGIPLEEIAGDLGILIGLAVILALSAMALYGWIEREARKTGALSMY